MSNRKSIWALFCVLTGLFLVAQSQILDYSYHLAEHTEALDSDTFYEDLEHGTLNKRIGVLLLGSLGIFWLVRQKYNDLHIKSFLGLTTIFFFLWIFLSIFWSDDYMLTARRSVSFALLWIAAIGFNVRFTERDTFLFLLSACMTYIVIGLSVELALGTFSPISPGYRFAGTLHPNHQAWNCVGVIFGGTLLWQTEERRRYLFLTLAAVGCIFLFLTGSRTSVVACSMAFIVYMIMVSNRKTIAFFALGASSLLCIFLIALGPVTVFESLRDAFLLGRTVNIETLTGRTDVWEFGMEYFLERPILGYGFNAFESVKRISELESLGGWVATSVHSEYLSLLLGVGVIGTIAYVIILLGSLLKTIILFRRSHDKYYAVSGALLMFFIVAMFMENLSQNPNIFMFVTFVILTRRGFMKEILLTDKYDKIFKHEIEYLKRYEDSTGP